MSITFRVWSHILTMSSAYCSAWCKVDAQYLLDRLIYILKITPLDGDVEDTLEKEKTSGKI